MNDGLERGSKIAEQKNIWHAGVICQKDKKDTGVGAHTKHRLKYHLVWIPKYEKRVLRGKIANRIREMFYQCASIHTWKIEELNIRVDHVYMLIQISLDISISKAVQYFKGGSSKIIRKEYPELEEFFVGR